MIRRGAQGYTLIELIVVLVLVGLLGSLTLPRLRHAVFSDDLQTAVRRLAGVVRDLRNEAQRQQTDFLLRFDLDAARFWIETRDMTPEGRGYARDKSSGLPAGVGISDVWLENEGTISAGDATIVITRKGYVQPSAIHLRDDGGREFTLRFQPFLPKEEVYDGYVDFRDRAW